MPYLHFDVADEVAARVRARAKVEGISTSRFLARLVTEATEEQWPHGYVDAISGSCPDFQSPERLVDPPVETWSPR